MVVVVVVVVVLHVCVLVVSVSCAKMAELVAMMFALSTQMCPTNCMLGNGPGFPRGKGQFRRVDLWNIVNIMYNVAGHACMQLINSVLFVRWLQRCDLWSSLLQL